jgi:glycosyltransferase involved in cell wall biosynthesis
MKILISVDPEIPVPPLSYGGVERLVDGLAEAYKDLGHEVYLLAHHESTCTHVKARYAWPARHSRGIFNILKNAISLLKIIRLIKPDAVHSFSRLLYMYPSFLTCSVPFLQTYGRFINPVSTTLASLVAGKKLLYTSAAAHMLNHLKRFRHKFKPVYNFTNTHFYTPDIPVEKKHLLFLGRIEDIKGTAECIAVALSTGIPLVIAGNIQPGHEAFFREKIEPHLQDPLIRWVGPVNDEQKRELLRQSKVLLFPIKWEEPFGIVMIEAMACGVPVIAFRRGSVPEVIEDGVTGFIVDNVEEMIEAVNRIGSIDQAKVREVCTDRFAQEKISKQYINLLENLIAECKK